MTEYQKLQFGNDAQTVENSNFFLKKPLSDNPKSPGKIPRNYLTRHKILFLWD
jgi:hypothetical protein